MKNFVDKWLSPPIYEGDEKKARDARFIALSLAELFFASSFVLLISLLDETTRIGVILVLIGGMTASAVLYSFLWHGYISLAGLGTLTLFYIFTTLLCIANGTVHAPASLIYIFIILVSGLLFEWRGILVSVLLGSLTVLGLILAENARLLPAPNHTLTLTNWFTYTVIFAAIGAISYYGTLSIRQALQEAEEDVRERKRSEARFRALFEQKSDGVFIFGLDGRTQDANHRAAEMLGYTLEELRDGKGREFFAASNQSENSLARLLAGEQIPLLERLLHTKDGTSLPVEINLELIRDLEGTPIHIQSIVRDISQRKHSEDVIRRANEELLLRMVEVEKLQAELREQAIRDPLTDLYNRRYLNETLGREIALAERENEPLSIILSDIDHFKSINDTYGHRIGDRFLLEVASFINAHTRSSDIVCRYGGEEFLIVLPRTTLHSAAERADEIRQKCAKFIIPHEGKDLSATMSFGVAAYPVHGHEASEIINKADQALYHSKQSGRNRVTIFS